MLLIPFLVGSLCLPKDAKHKNDTLLWRLATGMMVCYALYELLAVAFIVCNQSFRLLSVLYALSICLLAFLGVCRTISARRRLPLHQATQQDTQTEGKEGCCAEKGKWYHKTDIWFWLSFVLIFIQMGAILLWATPDKDDAFYSGLSSVCLSLDTVLKNDAYFGLLEYGVSARYAISALPAYQATLSLLTNGMHHLIITHNLFPLFYMPLAYGLYYSMGKNFLRAEQVEKAKGKLLFAIALLHMIGNYYVFSPENFLVTRIWQGKALFVAFGIPYIWHFTKLALDGMLSSERWQGKEWGLVAAGLFAACFMGETGLFLGPLMLLCMCLAHTILTRKIRHFLPALLCCIPQAGLLVLLMLG